MDGGGEGVEDDGVQEKDMTQLASILHAFLLLFVAGFCCMSMFSHRRAGFRARAVIYREIQQKFLQAAKKAKGQQHGILEP